MDAETAARLAAEFREEGVVRLPGLLSEEIMARLQEAYDWTLAHPGPRALEYYKGTGAGYYNDDAGTKESLPLYAELLEAYPVFAETCRQLWGNRNDQSVWFYDHDVWKKYGGTGRSTPYHQDTSYEPYCGDDLAVFWICLNEHVPKKNCLEVVAKSHNGPLYNGSRIGGDDDTRPLYKDKDFEEAGLPPLPRLPEIAKEREKWDLRSWDLKRGDVLVFHQGCLHGGAAVDPAFPERRSIVLRFFGDRCFFRNALPRMTGSRYRGLKDGDPWVKSRGGKWLRLLGPGLGEEGLSATAKL